MALKFTLSDLRNSIEGIHREIMREQIDGVAPNDIVLGRVRRENADGIKLMMEQLVDIALVKLLNEVSSRKGARASFDGPDLFGEYRGIPKSVTISRGRKKSTAQLTIPQADLWLKARLEKTESDKYETFRRMVDDCRPFQMSAEDSLAIAMERKWDAGRLTLTSASASSSN